MMDMDKLFTELEVTEQEQGQELKQEIKTVFRDHAVDDPSKPKIDLKSFAYDLAKVFGSYHDCEPVQVTIATTYRFQPERFEENDKTELEAIAGRYPLPKN